MSRIKEIHGTSQDVLYVFDFKTFKRTACIDYNNKFVHADLSGKDFEPLLCFPFLGNVSNQDRSVESLMLDCTWIGPENITMEVLPGLIEAMPHVDPETINFIVKGKEKKQGEAIYWPDIAFILVYASVQEKCSTVIKDDKIYIRVPHESEPESLPDTYHKPKPKRHKKQAKVRRLHVPPTDVVKYFRKEEPEIGWELPLRGMYLKSYWDYIKGQRIFNKGVAWLAEWCGLTERQIINIHNRMKVRRVEGKKRPRVKGIIKLRGRGWPGEGPSRWELPCNMGLVMRWRRHLPQK